MILAAASDTSIGQWGTLIVIVLGAVGALYMKVQDSKKDNVAQEIQKEQRDLMKKINDGQNLQNGKLATVVQVNQAYHDELIRALASSCKAQPTVVQQINQPKKEGQV